MKKYIIIAGVNGAGKSTLYQTIDSLRELDRVNPDEIVRALGDWRNPSDSIRAGKEAVNIINRLFDEGKSFNQESTLCGNSIVKNIKKAKALGYVVEMHFVSVDSHEIAKERIKYRVIHGGHGIPDEDVERRYYQGFLQLKKVIPLIDVTILYDNTERFRRFAIYRKENLYVLSHNIPAWYNKYIKIELDKS